MESHAVAHCLAAIRRIASLNEPSRRDLLQLGYNLGRLSEIAKIGREPCWDVWKDQVDLWDTVDLLALADRLEQSVSEGGVEIDRPVS